MNITLPVFTCLTLLLAAAKLFVGYDISWFVVFLPLIIPFVVAFVFFMVVAILAYKKNKERQAGSYPWHKGRC
jgi:heme/copper-type cytochrome/quinol oxidase subunit 2